MLALVGVNIEACVRVFVAPDYYIITLWRFVL